MLSISKRRLATPVLALVGLAVFAGAASAAPSVTLTKFGTGDVTIAGASATLENGSDEYSGVYLKSKSQSNKLLADVDFSFRYTEDSAVAGGAPRFSIPLNTGTGETPYAFLDALNTGTANAVSTNDPTARVFVGNESFDNWDDLAETYPTWRIASGKIPFVIADQPGTYKLTDIVLR